MSHGYLNGTEAVPEQIRKCESLVGGHKGRECKVYSCHKLFFYLDHLYNATEHREAYQISGTEGFHFGDTEQSYNFFKIRDRLEDLRGVYATNINL